VSRSSDDEAVAACVDSFAAKMADFVVTTDLACHRLPAWLKQAEATGSPPLSLNPPSRL
jgi:hypothetical protein